MGQGEGMIIAGDCQGNLYRIFYRLPQNAYTTAEEIQVADYSSFRLPLLLISEGSMQGKHDLNLDN